MTEGNKQTVDKKIAGAHPVSRAQQVIESRSGAIILGAISFVESALPIPLLTDPFLVAAIILNRARAVRLILITTASSTLGGMVAFLAAAYFLDGLLQFLGPELVHELNSMVEANESGTFVLTLLGAITPVPYTIVAWVVAILKGSLAVFLITSILGRGFRYAVVGYCAYRFGPAAVLYAKRYMGFTSVVVFVLIALYVWLKM